MSLVEFDEPGGPEGWREEFEFLQAPRNVSAEFAGYLNKLRVPILGFDRREVPTPVEFSLGESATDVVVVLTNDFVGALSVEHPGVARIVAEQHTDPLMQIDGRLGVVGAVEVALPALADAA